MVGGFSITPPPFPFFYPPTFLPRFPQVSVVAIAVIMLVVTHALAVRPPSAATAGTIAKSSYRPRLAHAERLHLPKRQYAVELPKRQYAIDAATTTRLHRHLLVSADAVRNGDQAARALVGSSPPKCIKKCGACTPCKSVLVPIHTANFPATPAEYYPEAWRCQCRGRIYNP